MLVLSRKLNEQIQIGDNITVTILRVKGNSVRVGIEAPRSVRVVRSELPPKTAAAGEGNESAEAADSCGDSGVAEESEKLGCTSHGPVFAALMQLSPTTM